MKKIKTTLKKKERDSFSNESQSPHTIFLL